MAILEQISGIQHPHTAAFSLGVALHVSVFRLGEWDTQAFTIIASFVALYVAFAGCSRYCFPSALGNPRLDLGNVSALFLDLLAGLYTSMLVYRALFHPLRRTPGPLLARLSSAYPTGLAIKKMHFFEEAKRLHDIYGDYVRVGPNEISVLDPKAVQAIHANSSPCTKGPWYNLQRPRISLQTSRDRADHARRRKIWDQALNSKALREYEPRVVEYTNQLLEVIEAAKGKPIDASLQFNLYGFDVMGNLAFGHDFKMIQSQKLHPSMELLHSSTKIVGVFSHTPWLFLLLKSLPGMVSEYQNFEKWLRSQMAKRIEDTAGLPDIFAPILKQYQSYSSPTKQDRLNLEADTMLIVVAGSDTTTASLTCLFLELCLNPDKYKLLQAEVDKHFSDTEIVDSTTLAKLPYLQACIDESLRMHSALPSGVQRQTPPQGLCIGEAFIPGNALVNIPLHSLFRDERVFAHPDKYIPERWTSKPELVKDNAVFAPFMIGRYSCAGKQLALMEMRSVVSQIARNYDVCLADEQNVDAFLDGVVDGFTLTCPKLSLVFTPRNG